MKKLSSEAIENLAIKFRGEIGISLNEPISIKSVLRKLNILTIYKPLSEKFYGISLKSNSNYCFILINSETTKGRQHYTIAHELYHLFYDDNPEPHICSDENGGKSSSEKNADAFAAALLMPQNGIMQFISLEEIVSKNIKLATIIKLEQYFSVSRSSLLFRLKSLNLLSEHALSALQNISVKESAKQYGYDTSLYCKGNENLVIGDFGEKARTLYENGTISEGHYLELLNLISNDKD